MGAKLYWTPYGPRSAPRGLGISLWGRARVIAVSEVSSRGKSLKTPLQTRRKMVVPRLGTARRRHRHDDRVAARLGRSSPGRARRGPGTHSHAYSRFEAAAEVRSRPLMIPMFARGWGGGQLP